MRPEKMTVLAPRRLMRVSAPFVITRLHRLAVRSLRVGATHRLPCRLPKPRRVITILTVAASESLYLNAVPLLWVLVFELRLATNGLLVSP